MEEITACMIPENKWDLENGVDVYCIAFGVSPPKNPWFKWVLYV